MHKKTRKISSSVYLTRKWCQPSLLNPKFPIFALAAVAIASTDQEEESPSSKLEKWILTEVMPRYTKESDVMSELLARTKEMSDSELEAVFASVSSILLDYCSSLLADEEYENALRILDEHWMLAARVRAMFKFPQEMTFALSLESDVHKAMGNTKASRHAKKILWRLMKQYEWLGAGGWGSKVKNQVSFYLATVSAAENDCDATKYLLRDCIQFARQSVVQNDTEDEENDYDTAKNLFELLTFSLRSYYYLKGVMHSPCALLFKYSARDAYDIIEALNPGSLPVWKDLKLGVKGRIESQINDPDLREQVAEASLAGKNALSKSVMGHKSEKEKAKKENEPIEDPTFAPTELLAKSGSQVPKL